MPGLTRWWRSRSDTDRIEIYTVWSFYLGLLGLPLLLLTAVAPRYVDAGAAWDVALVAAVVAFTAGSIALARAGFAGDTGRPWRAALVVAVVAGAAVVGIGLRITSPTGEDGRPSPSGPWLVGLVVGALLIGLSITLRYRLLVGVSVAGGVLAAAVALLRGAPAVSALPVAASIGIALVAVAAAFRFSVWLLDVVREQERTRGVQAQLAVAEERLRFARDLHDVMGRNLSAISVKSQLAEQLVRRGRPEGADEVAAIGALAASSLAEVREVVRGYRAVDLGSELAGARSVLRAAGIDCVVTGADAVVPAQVQVVLGWAVREAVTNVLRHGSGGSCTIDVVTRPDDVVLTVANGAGGTVGGWGSGLTGLAERLTAAGGQLTAGPDGDRFVLTAGVPT